MIKFNDIKIADIGFYINLDKREDRKEKIESQLIDFNISGVERHSAFSGYDSNTLNCKRSHLQLMEKLLETDFETLLILEDDCLFLDVLKEDGDKIFNDINNTEWDVFWLGCRNRRNPIKVKNNCLQVSSVSYAQSYLIKRDFCKFIIDNFSETNFFGQPVTPDELLSLAPYGVDVVTHPDKYDYYNLDQPLDVLPTIYKAMCYKFGLTTQYSSYSDLWFFDVNYEEYITQGYPKDEQE
jgi:GR25 family glycosyltransferase involved in LPS biosynthesis